MEIKAEECISLIEKNIEDNAGNLIEKNSSRLAAGLDWVYDRSYTQETQQELTIISYSVPCEVP